MLILWTRYLKEAEALAKKLDGQATAGVKKELLRMVARQRLLVEKSAQVGARKRRQVRRRMAK